MIKLDKKHSGVFAAGVLFEQQESNFFPAKMQKSLYELYSSCSSCKRLRNENCIQGSGERRRYLCRSTADQRRSAQQLRKHLKILLKKKHLKKQKKLQQKRNKNKAPAERNCRCFS